MDISDLSERYDLRVLRRYVMDHERNDMFRELGEEAEMAEGGLEVDAASREHDNRFTYRMGKKAKVGENATRIRTRWEKWVK